MQCARSIKCKTGKISIWEVDTHTFANILIFGAQTRMKQHQLNSTVELLRRNGTENGNYRRLRNHIAQSQSIQTVEFSAK